MTKKSTLGKEKKPKIKTDIEIAREAIKLPIQEIGQKLGIEETDLIPFGHDKAKISETFIALSYVDSP